MRKIRRSQACGFTSRIAANIIPATNADAGMVIIQAHMMFVATPQRTAFTRCTALALEISNFLSRTERIRLTGALCRALLPEGWKPRAQFLPARSTGRRIFHRAAAVPCGGCEHLLNPMTVAFRFGLGWWVAGSSRVSSSHLIEGACFLSPTLRQPGRFL